MGFEWRHERARTAGRRRETRVHVEHDAAVLHHEAALSKPPQCRRLAIGLLDFIQQYGPALHRLGHRVAALSNRSRIAAQAASWGGVSTAIQSQPSASASCSFSYNAAA